MVADKSDCWWCRTDSHPERLIRLDEIHGLGGYVPGAYGKSGGKRICMKCIELFAVLRLARENELRSLLPQMPGQPTG